MLAKLCLPLFFQLVLCFLGGLQETAQIKKAIKDLDSLDENQKDVAARLIYRFSVKQTQPDLIIPAIINQLKHKEKYKVTLDFAVESLTCYGVLPSKFIDSAIPAIIDGLDDPDISIRLQLADILNKQGKAALPFALAAFPAKPGDNGKTYLLQFFSKVGPDASAAIPLLLEDLKKRPSSEGAICAAIVDVDCENERAASFFLRRMDDAKCPDYEKRVWAWHLARNSKHGNKAERYLAKGLQDKDPSMLMQNLISMWHIKDLSNSKEQIERVFNDANDDYMRIVAAAMLVRMNKDNSAARKFLSDNEDKVSLLLKIPEWEYRLFAIWVAREIADKNALTTLERLAREDGHKTVREHANAAVMEIKANDK